MQKIQAILNHKKTPFYIGAFLLILTFILFFPVLSHNFITDDFFWLYWVRDLDWNFTSLKEIFFSTDLQASKFYRPLILISFLLDSKIAGLNEVYYYFETLFFNGLNTALIFWLVYKIINGKQIIKILGGLTASVSFLLLPVHTDSLMWIAERTDVLATTFGLIAVLLFVLYRQQVTKSWKYFIPIFFAVLLSFLSKEIVGAGILLLIFSVDISINPLKHFKKIKYWVPYLFVGLSAVGYMAMRTLAYGSFNSDVALVSYRFSDTLIYLKYLSHPFLTNEWLGLIVTVLVVVTLIYCFKYNKKLAALLVLWSVGLILLTQIGHAGVDRWRLYLPSLAIMMLIGVGYAHLQSKASKKIETIPYFKIFKSIISIFLIVFISTSLITMWREMQQWKVASHAAGTETETLVMKVDELDCYSHILLINSVYGISTNLSYNNYREKIVITDFSRGLGLKTFIGDDKYQDIPTIVVLSSIPINKIENSDSSAKFINDHTLEVSGRYIVSRGVEGIFKSERSERTPASIFNRITLEEGLTFSDFGVLEYRDGIYYDHSVPCAINK